MTELETYVRKNLPGVEDCGEKEWGVKIFEVQAKLACSPSFDLKLSSLPPLEGLKIPAMEDVWACVGKFYTESGYSIERTLLGLIAKKDGLWECISISPINQNRVRFSVESMGEE
jgi:hypothetical protein